MSDIASQYPTSNLALFQLHVCRYSDRLFVLHYLYGSNNGSALDRQAIEQPINEKDIESNPNIDSSPRMMQEEKNKRNYLHNHMKPKKNLSQAG